MKKFFTIFALIICLLLAACGNEPKEEPKPNMTVENKEATVVIGDDLGLTISNPELLLLNEDMVLELKGDKIVAIGTGTTTFSYIENNTKYNYSVTVNKEVLEIKNNKFCIVSGQMDMIEYDINSKNKVSFASLDENIVTVTDNGGIKAVKIGEAEIKVSTDYSQTLISVEVVDTKETIEIVEDACALEMNSVKYLLNDSANKKNENVKFEVEGDSVKISEHGIVTATSVGSSIVKITDANGITKNITIKVFERFNTIDFTNDKQVNVFGRAKISENRLIVYHGVSGFECKFEGTEISATIESDCSLSPYAYIKVYVDDQEYSIGLDKGASAEYVLATGLTEGTHNIRVLKRTEESAGKLVFSNIKATKFVTPNPKRELKFEVYGDSYTAGYGALGKTASDPHNATNEDCTSSYAFVASEILNAQLNMFEYSGISMGIPGWVKDFKLPDIAPYYGSNDKTPWDYNNYVPDVIIIYLGTNDNYGLSQKFGTANDFIVGYRNFINYLLKKSPDAKIVCCYGFSSMNSQLETAIKNMPTYFPKNAYAFKLPSAILGGSNGHPNQASQIKGGEALAEFIKTEVLNLVDRPATE